MLQFPKNPTTDYSQKINRLLILKEAVQHIPLSKNQEAQLFHTQLLQSSLFSAKIEGNTLSLTQAKHKHQTQSKDKNHIEIDNLLKAYEFSKSLEKISLSNILNIHGLVMDSLRSDKGKLRTETSAIFDNQGNAVYITPDPDDMKAMLEIVLSKLNQKTPFEDAVILTAQCHYYFEKIHPFIDGNGRTGRVILQWQLLHTSVTSQIIPIEKYFNDYKSDYYFFLEKNTTQIDEFINFFLDALISTHEQTLDSIKQLPKNNIISSLLPRRQEILQIISDHPYCSLDFLARSFPTLSRRMISYDVKALLEKDFIIKQGTTRGATYIKK